MVVVEAVLLGGQEERGGRVPARAPEVSSSCGPDAVHQPASAPTYDRTGM